MSCSLSCQSTFHRTFVVWTHQTDGLFLYGSHFSETSPSICCSWLLPSVYLIHHAAFIPIKLFDIGFDWSPHVHSALRRTETLPAERHGRCCRGSILWINTRWSAQALAQSCWDTRRRLTVEIRKGNLLYLLVDWRVGADGQNVDQELTNCRNGSGSNRPKRQLTLRLLWFSPMLLSRPRGTFRMIRRGPTLQKETGPLVLPSAGAGLGLNQKHITLHDSWQRWDIISVRFGFVLSAGPYRRFTSCAALFKLWQTSCDSCASRLELIQQLQYSQTGFLIYTSFIVSFDYMAVAQGCKWEQIRKYAHY